MFSCSFMADQVFWVLWTQVEPLGSRNILQFFKDLFLEEWQRVSWLFTRWTYTWQFYWLLSCKFHGAGYTSCFHLVWSLFKKYSIAVCRLAIEADVWISLISFNNQKTYQVVGWNYLVSPSLNLALVHFCCSLILLLLWFCSFMNYDRPHLLAIQDPMVRYLSILFNLT